MQKFRTIGGAYSGIGLGPEDCWCFVDLTVDEKLITAVKLGERMRERVVDLFPRFGERDFQTVLSLCGEKQLGFASFLARMTNPKLPLLDLVTHSLVPTIRHKIWPLIAKPNAITGMPILAGYNSIKQLRDVWNCAVIFERGRTVWYKSMVVLTAGFTQNYLGIP